MCLRHVEFPVQVQRKQTEPFTTIRRPYVLDAVFVHCQHVAERETIIYEDATQNPEPITANNAPGLRSGAIKFTYCFGRTLSSYISKTAAVEWGNRHTKRRAALPVQESRSATYANDVSLATCCSNLTRTNGFLRSRLYAKHPNSVP